MLIERIESGIAVERGRQLMTATALVWLCYELAGLSWQMIAPSDGVLLPSLAASSSVTSSLQKRYNLQDMVQYHLFGEQKGEVSAPVPDKVIDVPKTRLNLTLRGLFAAENGAFALIATGSAEEQVYQVGMLINPSTRIEAIHADSVVLDRGGKLEVLYLDDEAGSLGKASRTTRNSVQASAVADNANTYGEQRARLLKNPQEAMRFARVQPVMQQGKMVGYRVNPGAEPKLFNELGFQAGDLVKEVNGITVNDPTKIGDLMNQLTSARELSVTIERRGRTENLQIKF